MDVSASSSYPEDRLRYWNGYLLFYERMEEPATPATAKKSKIVKKVLTDGGYVLVLCFTQSPRSLINKFESRYVGYFQPLPACYRKSCMDSDSLMELTELVHKGERKGIFVDKMPASIQQIIHAENVTFVKNRDVYNHEYFSFVKNLVSVNAVSSP